MPGADAHLSQRIDPAVKRAIVERAQQLKQERGGQPVSQLSVLLEPALKHDAKLRQLVAKYQKQ